VPDKLEELRPEVDCIFTRQDDGSLTAEFSSEAPGAWVRVSREVLEQWIEYRNAAMKLHPEVDWHCGGSCRKDDGQIDNYGHEMAGSREPWPCPTLRALGVTSAGQVVAS
jgi:hypothetical protein